MGVYECGSFGAGLLAGGEEPRQVELHGEYGCWIVRACIGDGRGDMDLFRVAYVGVDLVAQFGREAEERGCECVGKGARRVR